jgi:hypothetical protein
MHREFSGSSRNRVRIFFSKVAGRLDIFRLPLRAGVGTALALAMLLAGCGVPGEPLPPLLEIPAPIQDLAAAQEGTHLHLHWSPPVLTTEGTRARELDRLEIYGAFLAPASSPAEFASHARLLATFPLASANQPASVYDVTLNSGNLRQKAFFALKAFNHKGKDAGFSNIASVEILDLPQAPSDLQAKVTEKAIELSWKVSTLSPFGGPAPAGSYRVYRADASGDPQEIGTTENLAYQDSSFEFGHKYRYSVRAFVQQGDSTAVTPLSDSVEISAIDKFPPSAPRNLRAIAVPGAVELAWSPNGESDLDGYNVYRKSGELFTRLNAELLRIPTFRDSGVAAGERVVYVVKAADKSGNESLPSEEASVTTE